MEKKYQRNRCAVALTAILLRFVIFVLLGLFVQTGFARSVCERNTSNILECDLSISLVEKHINQSGMATEQAWYATSEQRVLLEHQLEQFAEHWCDVTLGKSSIRKISILRGYKKSSADVALYRNTGRSYSYVGAFSELYPSIVLYYAGFYNPQTIDRNLGRVLVHEFAHASLKVYDEYRELGAYSSPYCLNPLATDFPRATIMNDHTRYTRFSHPDDYADTPPAQTAQYRCYGKSAWEVLMQPERCDSNLSLEINAWFPRQDYFAAGFNCSPQTPALSTLENPRNNNAVNTCIRNTQENLRINFLSSAENITVLIDSGIEQANKVEIAEAVKRSLDNFVADATTSVVVIPQQLSLEEAERLIDMQRRKIALGDFNDDQIPEPQDIQEYIEEQEKILDGIINGNPDERKSIDDVLNMLEEYYGTTSDKERSILNGNNTLLIISDTNTVPSASTLRFFKDNNIVVNTISIGDTINPGLSTLSLETGGKTFTAPETKTAETAKRGSFELSRTPVQIEVEVPQSFKGPRSISFHLYWDATTSELDEIYFVDPNGTRLNTSSIYHTTYIQTHETESFSWTNISNAEAGVWTVYVMGYGPHFEYETKTTGLYSVFTQNFGTNVDAGSGYIHIGDDTRIPIRIEVPPGSESMTFDIYWDANNFSNRLDRIDFFKPDGTKFDSPDLRMFKTNSFSWSSIASPRENFNVEAGRWTIYVIGNGRFEYETKTVSLIDASVHAGAAIMPRTEEKTTIIYPGPFPIMVRAHGHIPLLYAKVTAELITPKKNSAPISINLLDNGKSPDATARDGIYSGIVKNYAEYGDGMYTIKATINNPDGNAVFDDGGVATFGTTRTAAPLEAPPFHRVLYHQVEVKGTKATLTNTDYSRPRDIKADGTLNWGTLSDDHDTNWYRFRANNTGEHYIQTSNLLKHDSVEMTTHVDLYKQDPNNGSPLFLGTSAGYRGTNISQIKHPLVEGEYYLVSVSHVNNNGGTYGLTVNSGNSLLSDHEINRAINSGGGSSGGGSTGGGSGGGSMDYFLLVLMLATLAAFYVRTNPVSARRRIFML